MNRVAKMTLRVAENNIDEQLKELLPDEVFRCVQQSDLRATPGDVLEALLGRKKFVIQIETSRYGNPYGSGGSSGMILAINQEIKPVGESDPGGSHNVGSPKIFHVEGNKIDLAHYTNTRWSLD